MTTIQNHAISTSPVPRLVILGAGASVDSGLKTYRGASGVYSSGKICEVGDLTASEESRLSLFRTCQLVYADAAANRPGLTYEKLKPFVSGACVVTMNVDGYAKLAFAETAEQVIEFHGNMHRCSCIDCGQGTPTPCAMFRKACPVELADLTCSFCRGRLRPCVVLLGEKYSEEVLRPVYTFIGRRCPREVLVVGTSLQFAVFRDFINRAKRRGAKVTHVNPDPTYGAYNVRKGECWLRSIEELTAPFS